MAKPDSTSWEIKPHTRAKHEILRRYLGAWFPILGSGNTRVVYIDGFCGPGRYQDGEDGSPIIALKEAMSHSKLLAKNKLTFLFLDEREDRINQLKEEIEGMNLPPNFTALPLCGKFEELEELLNHLKSEGKQLAPTFVFIDPFGFSGLPFRLVQRLLENEKTEVFVNIMISAINRFLCHPEDGVRKRIVELYGTDEVLNIAQTSTDRDLDLRLLYQRQLQKSARFVRYFEMRDRRNQLIYCLFFASNHPLGHSKMKEAFWKVDKQTGFCFSDATDPHQLIMFEQEDISFLISDLRMKFSRKNVLVKEIENYVEDETMFTGKHMRKALKQLEDQGKITVEDAKTDGKKRRKGTFPPEATVSFE